MKKRSLTVFALLLALTTTKTIAQTIPNGSFERWVIKNGVEAADGWNTSQELQCTPPSAGKTTDKVDSTFAMLLETSNCALAGGIHEGFAIKVFRINKKPIAFNGSYKATRVNTDSSQIKVILKKSGAEVGSATINIYATVANYKTFSVPIQYTGNAIPDTAEIYLFSDKIGKEAMGNKLWVDKLSFADSVTGIAGTQAQNAGVSVFPNPAQNVVNISITNQHKDALYIITDPTGRTMQSGTLTKATTAIEIQQLAPGFYFIQVDNGTRTTAKILKQ